VKKSELVFISKGKVRSGRLTYMLLLLEILTHLPLHLIDLAWLEHTLNDNVPIILVRVSIIANGLGSQHECGDDKAVTRRSPSGREVSLQTLKEDGGGRDGDEGMQLHAMEGVGNEVR
jgi:hypothetical protein